MGRGRKTKDTQPAKKRRPAWQRALRWLTFLIDIAVVAALMLTGYAGNVSPLAHSAWWGVLPMGFPIVFWIAATLMLLQMFWFRRGAAVLALGFVACGGPSLTYFPLNIGTPKAPAGAEELRLLTYNTRTFALCDPGNPGVAEYILTTDADIVALQESHRMLPPHADGATIALADSIRARYPHISFGGSTGSQAVLSKYPIEQIHLDVSKASFHNGDISAYRVTLPSGRRIAVFNVHMQSFSLAKTNLRRAADSDTGRREVIDKLLDAAPNRARQVNKLHQWLRLYGGPDVIIAGDFNDVQGCYAIRSLADAGFASVYPQIGLGPMITFNDRRLYFCIDHVLYRGSLKPLGLKRGNIKASDHYPLTVRFAVE